MRERSDKELLGECLAREARLWEIFNCLNDAIFVHNPATGDIIDVNQRACELYGYTREELLRLEIVEISSGIPPYTQKHAMELLKKAAAGEPQLLEWCAKDKDGRLFWVEVNMRRAIRGEDDWVVVSVRDVFERRKADEALRESEERFKSLVEQSPLSIQIFDPVGKTVQINQAYQDLWGVTLEDIRDYNVLHDEQLERSGLMTYLKRGFAGEAVSIPPVEYDAKDTVGKGYKRWIRANIYPVKDNLGNIRNVVLVHEDITELKRSEEEKRAFYRQTILSATDGKLLICDELAIRPYTQATQLVADMHEASELSNARQEIAKVFLRLGIDPERLGTFAIAVGEALTNALKHAGRGRVYAGRTEVGVWVAVEDYGPGIDSIILPGAILRRGFSTKQSMGLGYSIMLHASDCILLKTDSHGTAVVLFRNLNETVLDVQILPDTWDTM